MGGEGLSFACVSTLQQEKGGHRAVIFPLYPHPRDLEREEEEVDDSSGLLLHAVSRGKKCAHDYPV